MSKRLQVLLEEPELKAIQKAAKQKRMTVAEWVRQALRLARNEQPDSDSARKLEAIRRAVKSSFPTADIETMNREIERGYGDQATP
jgi:hypothetical protein